jgi:dienelactone hydrolase
MNGIVGARLAILQDYCRTADSASDRLRHQSRMLAVSLANYTARCREYRTPGIDDLDQQVGELALHIGQLSAWVCEVAALLHEAGNIGMVGVGRVSLPQPARPPLLMGPLLVGPGGLHLRMYLPPSGLAQLTLVRQLLRERVINTAVELDARIDRGVALFTHSVDVAASEMQAMLRGVADRAIDGVQLLGDPQTWHHVGAAAAITDDYITIGPYSLEEWGQGFAWLRWHQTALLLLSTLSLAELSLALNHNNLSGSLMQSGSLVVPLLLACGIDVAALSVVSDARRIAGGTVHEPADLLDQVMQSFWNCSMHRIDPLVLQRLAAVLDRLNRRVCPTLDSCSVERPPSAVEPPADLFRRTVLVGPYDVFPARHVLTLPDGRMALRPGAAMDGMHAMISGFRNEQVSLARIDQDAYLVGVFGLDPKNMAVSPNGLEAVIQTGFYAEREQNHYYTYVRERVLDHLAALPAGSAVHITGHSMGGGMILLLLNDRQVQRSLRDRGQTIASVVTYGAVRPNDPDSDEVPQPAPEDPAFVVFDGVQVRHYVDPEDRLAMNVGAGHIDYADVYFIDNGIVDDPVAAHTSYHAGQYSFAGDEALLPYTINPAYFELFNRERPDAFVVP